ncbi:hypothetical protein ES705_46935 [subsurface metagenome]
MKVSELIGALENHDGDTEVRIMIERPWGPFEYSIYGIWQGTNIDDVYGEAVYILEGNKLGYGTKRAWGKGDEK